jgi:hypothetical protein
LAPSGDRGTCRNTVGHREDHVFEYAERDETQVEEVISAASPLGQRNRPPVEDLQCGGWVLGDNRGNVRCTEDRKHKGPCSRPTACRLPNEDSGTCYRDVDHNHDCEYEWSGRCEKFLVSDDLLVQCRKGVHHRGDHEAKQRTGREAVTQALLARLGGETWIKIPAGLSEEDRYDFEDALDIEGVKTVITGEVVSLTLEKPPASLDFVKP